MRLLIFSTTLLALAQSAIAAFGVSITLPSTSLTADTLFTISFADNGGTPALAQLATGVVQLWVGGITPTDSLPLDSLGTVTYASASSLSVSIKGGLAASVPDGFYLSVRSSVTGGGTIINYSKRFSVSGMTGTTLKVYTDAVTASVPDDVGLEVAPAAGAAGGQFTVPYNLQTGLTKYAPMQSMPPTKITKKNPTPLYPTSAYVKATTWLGSPTVLTTLTAPQTVSIVSMENTAAPQPMPNAQMAKFLARWRD